jgi:pimeloyl-ACP methyl ester carboxylesterase
MEPQIRFCASADGVRIAYATAGEGPPLLCSSGWMADASEDRRRFADALGPRRLVVTYDQRGLGARALWFYY